MIFFENCHGIHMQGEFPDISQKHPYFCFRDFHTKMAIKARKSKNSKFSESGLSLSYKHNFDISIILI